MPKTMARNTRKKMVGKREAIDRAAREHEYIELEEVLHQSWNTDPYDRSEHGYELPDGWDHEPDSGRDQYE